MGKSVRSARGAMVDFDMLKIKQALAAAPKPTVVKDRENFVDNKIKRKIRKLSRPKTEPDATIDVAPDTPEESE